jgi:hypothetical protein
MMIDGFTTRSIVRVPVSPEDPITWRAGGLTGYSGNTAQGPDGTIFTIVGQLTSAIGLQVFANQAIVGIDGETGVQRFAVKPIRPSYYCDPFFGDPDFFVSRFADGITVDSEGYANVLGVVLDRNDQWVTPPPCQKGPNDDFYQAARIVLYRIAPDGTSRAIDLYRHAAGGAFTFRGPFYTLPDDQGGVLAAWGACNWSGTLQDCRIYAVHVDGGNTPGPAYELPNDPNAGMVSGSDRTAYFGSMFNTPTRRFDMRSGGVAWTNNAAGRPLAVRADGRVEIQSGFQRIIFDPAAALPPSHQVDPPLIQTAGNSRVTSLYGDVRSVVAESFMPDQFGFAIAQFSGAPTGGGLQNRSAAPGHYGVFFKGHDVAITNFAIARHSSLRMTPRNARWRTFRPDVFGGSQFDTLGHFFATLGAGPGDHDVRSADSTSNCSLSGWPWLTKGVNTSSDVLNPYKDLERLHYDNRHEDSLILRLLQLFSNYRNDLEYCFMPDGPTPWYNSNSFVRGLLDAAGVAPKPLAGTLLPYVGWSKPVPAPEFGVGSGAAALVDLTR